MGVISLDNASIAFGQQDILFQISLSIQSGDRIALTGGNGSGKTTLLRILAGETEPDSGNTVISKNSTVSYLPQTLEFNSEKTLFNEAETAFDGFSASLERKKTIETILENKGQNDSISSLLHELDSIHEHLLHSGFYDQEKLIEKILTGLGFSKEDFKKKCSAFSGGWKMRIALAKILLESPDFMLLDEPTNYLDIDARIWLTEFISSYHGGILLVSHDKQFLDNVVNQIFHLYNANLTSYKGTYSEFELYLQEEQEKLIKAYNEQQKEIKRIEQFIERFRYKDSKSSQVQSRIKYLEKMNKIELPHYIKKIHFSFPSPPHSGRNVLDLKHIYKSYGEHTVIENFNLLIKRNDRIAITGKNGTGKTTLMKIIAQQDNNFSGVFELGTGVRTGYFQQDIDSTLQAEHSIYDELAEEAPNELLPKIRSYLGSFLFSEDDIHKPLSVLSGGEKSRVQLLKLLLQPYNFLILDEPTNHLDITSKEVLLTALKEFSGTIVFVSHDLFFIKELTNRIIYLKEKTYAIYDGDYDYFLWKISHQEEENDNNTIKKIKPDFQKEDKKESKKTSHEQQKRDKNRYNSILRDERELIHQIDEVEHEIGLLQEKTALPEIYSDGKKILQVQKELYEKENLLEKLHKSWEKITLEIEDLKEKIVL